MADIILPIDAVAGAPQFPAAQHRVANASLMLGRTDRALGTVSGIRPGADPVVTLSVGSPSTWTVTPTNGFIDPPLTNSAMGPYLFAFTANKTGVLGARDATNTRYDRIDIQVPDDPAGGATPAPVYIVTPGVAQSNPQLGMAAAPARSIPLGYFVVPNSGNASFVPTYTYCVSSGGILPTRTGYRPANPYIGEYIDDAAAGLMRWDGAVWKQLIKALSGTAILGVLDPAKGTNEFYGHSTVASDAGALITINIAALGASAILRVTLTNVGASNLIFRPNISSVASLVFQTRTAATTTAAAANTASEFWFAVEYQK